MAGIYIHIPFCKQKCSYCDFHFSTSLKYKEALLHSIIKEVEIKKTLVNQPINTIYFGGGTPSILNSLELSLILNALHKNFTINPKVEFTFECNPDDLSKKKLLALKTVGVNRLSIGVQSFFNDDLQFFNRAHNAKEAEQCIKLSQDAGIANITIDLMYNTPALTQKKWECNLEKVKLLNIPHLSAYTLTVEPKTTLYHQVKNNLTKLPTEKMAIKQFELLINKTAEFGLTQYEVSNFGKEGFFSQHNSNYWKGAEYFGIGPSAHSYYNNTRSWNVANNVKYINLINNNKPFFEVENINEKTAYNEYILTRLRTIWGVDKQYIQTHFNKDINNHFNMELAKYLKTSYIQTINNKIVLTKKGVFIVDKISSDLFIV